VRHYRRNSDVRLRRLERAVSAGDTDAIVPLIQERLRQKAIKPKLAKEARYFSFPMTMPGSTVGTFNWYPLAYPGDTEINTDPEAYTQDPRTLVLWAALIQIFGDYLKLPTSWTKAAGNWMEREGFWIFETDDLNHAPHEIQSDDNIERETEAQQRRTMARQLQIYQEYGDATGTYIGPGEGGDPAYMWLVKQRLFVGDPKAISIMKYLRYNSTVEYCNVLGANVYSQKDRKDPPFGLTEHLLISTWLGGAPL
jgi:hypothetical protein